MTPAARLSAAIEVLQAAADGAPVDVSLKAWGRAHRFAGSGDRRAIGARVYATLRARAAAAWRMQDDGPRALVLGALVEADGLGADAVEALFGAGGHGPAPLTAAERARLAETPAPAPDWVRAGVPAFAADLLSARWGDGWTAEAQALVGGRAHLDVRVNTARSDPDTVRAALAEAGIEAESTPFSAHGLRLAGGAAPDLTRLPLFAAGAFEVQDEGSQIVSWLAGARPGMTVVDWCAGGGGKTLAIGMLLGEVGGGGLHAFDLDPKRLDAIRPRLARAGVEAALAVIGPDGEGSEPLEGSADLVLVDAPCSGSGTWRRRPEAPWRLTSEEVERLAALQTAILARAARLVRPGGRLAYVTCSVLPPENEAVAVAFAAAQPAFRPVPIARAAQVAELTPAGQARLAALAGGAHTVQLSPLATDTDGFFAALFERPA